MWWLIPIGIGIAGKMVYDYLTNQEIEARKRWEIKHKEVKINVKQHRKNIETHIHEAKNSYNFKLLADVHFSSFIVADSAYKLLDDARSSLDAIGKLILKSKAEKEELSNQRKKIKTKKGESAVIENIKILNEFRRSVYDDKDKIKIQRDELFTEVKRLNQQTNELKTFIRDRCGAKGEDWYERLEERRKQKKIAEVK